MNHSHHFTIGFKFREKDYTARVSAYASHSFGFYRVSLNDDDLVGEFGKSLSFARNALTGNVESVKKLPEELENSIANELNLMG